MKAASCLMELALEDREDIFLALLTWRNTPSELGPSPAEIMFGIRTRTQLPSTTDLMKSLHDKPTHDALVAVKDRQSVILQPRSSRKTLTCCGSVHVGMTWRNGEKAK